MADVKFFKDDSKEVARRRKYAEAIAAQASQPLDTQIVSGIAVKRSPIEGLVKALQSGLAGYEGRKADELESAQEARRSQLMAQALEAHRQDPTASAKLLMQDPSMSSDAMNMGFGAIDAERKAAADAAMLERERGYKNSDWAREAALRRELAMMRGGANGNAISPQLNPETGEYELVQPTEPRKLSAMEQKNFYKQKDKTDAVRNAMGVLGQVEAIKSEPIYSGAGSKAMAFANRIPVVGAMFDDEKAANTTTMNNLLNELAYSKLQSTFPGAISNAERESLEKLQAVSSYSLPEQQKIIQEAKKVLQRQGAISSEMQKDIVTGNIYNVNGIPNIEQGGLSEKAANVKNLLIKRGFTEQQASAFLQQNGLR